MSSEVKRYDAVHLRYEDSNIRYGEGCEVEVVTASDYAAIEAECANLKNSLLAITARHFAESWKKRASDAELEQYLSAGIAQLEAERDKLHMQLAACGLRCCRLGKHTRKRSASKTNAPGLYVCFLL